MSGVSTAIVFLLLFIVIFVVNGLGGLKFAVAKATFVKPLVVVMPNYR